MACKDLLAFLSLGRVSGQARSKVAKCPGVPALQSVSPGVKSQAPLPRRGQETPSTSREGGWRDAACQRSPSFFLTPSSPARPEESALLSL